MKINIKDAFAILNIHAGNITPADIKKAYRKAAQKFHPDKNAAGLEMMQLINAAYEAIKDFSGEAVNTPTKDYGNKINAALNAIIGLGLKIEICGAWVWINGNTKPHKETLKTAGYKWSPKKLLWYFRPEDYKSRNHKAWSMEKIYNKYGRDAIEEKQKALQTSH